MLVQHCGGRTGPIDNRQPSVAAVALLGPCSGKFLHVMWLCAQRTTSPSPLLWSGPNIQLLDHTAMSERKERLKEDEVGRGGARRNRQQGGRMRVHFRTLFATCLPVNPTYCTMIGIPGCSVCNLSVFPSRGNHQHRAHHAVTACWGHN